MMHRIEVLPSFRLVGVHIRTTTAFGKGMRDCPKLWKQFIKNNYREKLIPLINHKPFGIIGASVYNVEYNNPRLFDYYIAVATDAPAPDGFLETAVPAMTWAIFKCTKKTLAKTERWIVNTWSKSSDYQLLNSGYFTGKMKAAAPDLEVYKTEDDVEIWVPVSTKKGANTNELA